MKDGLVHITANDLHGLLEYIIVRRFTVTVVIGTSEYVP
jgi:hypothetical protein